MKKLPKVIGFVLLGIVLLIGIFISYLKFALPNVGDPEEINVELTPERIERGKYLAHSVTICMDCHAIRDWSKFSGPPTEGTLGKGGDRFDQTVGLPGVYLRKKHHALWHQIDIPMVNFSELSPPALPRKVGPCFR